MNELLNSELKASISRIVSFSLEEDIGSGDITAQLIPENSVSEAYVITREQAVICGRPWFDETFKQLDPGVEIQWLVEEGELVQPDQKLVTLSGNSRSLLTGERTALNFLQTLMGTATTSRQYAKLVEGTNTTILDTRKTIPGLRLAQKYAVKVGGCSNHRIGLFDAYLIKENHIAACGGINKAIEHAKQNSQGKIIEVEVESISELQQAIEGKADVTMLDNFSMNELEEASKIKNNDIKYELSGNIELDTFTEMEAVLDKIDYVSSGSLTKHIKAIDLSMRISE